ncbi:MAG: hypothetical protein M1839_000829 [Geoglossum umbratile]|nr:MAG: hypothetical protein M1839_000829 [Geoglossum umbratile]
MWLQKCIDFHSLCNAVGNVPHIMPSRLLYIEYSSQSHPTVLLVEVKEADHKIEYLAFSHCWGDCEAFKLSTANYNTSLEGIKFFELSKNSQHAIQITLRLGYSYIWIDSLCIIQDSPLDWATESAKMGNVYSNAVCTIASTGSSSGDGGCFHERDYHSLRPYGIRVTLLGEFVGSIYIWRDDVFDFERNVDRAPLNKRGWVLQERLLSRRILHFGADMLYWECWQRSASEVNTNGYIYKKYPDDFEDDYTPPLSGVSTRTDLEWAERSGQGTTWQMQEMIRRRPPPPLLEPDDPPTSHTIWQRKRGFWKEIRKSSTDPWGADSTEGNLSGLRAAFTSLRNDEFSHNDVGMSSFSHYWYEIVEPYTRGRLSFSKDKQVALFGIVKEIKDATKYTYLAGLWKEHLLTSLLWFATEGPGRRLMTEPQQTGADDSTQADGTTDKPTTYIAPTWSWVSLEGTVGVDLLPDNSLGGLSVERRLAEIVTFPEEPNRELNSSIPVGHLRVQGHLCKISKVKRGDTLSYIKIGNSIRNSARLFPDIAEDDISNDPDLFCLPILDLKRNTSGRSKKEIQGLVLRRTKRGGNSFERVGFFTSRMDQWFQSRKMFTEAPIEIVEIV